jgi:hypothetical protein
VGLKAVSDWPAVLNHLSVGDIFHASCPNGASLICLIEAVTQRSLQTRTVTHQIKLEFDLTTGSTLEASGAAPCTIDSVARLPADIHNVILGLDQKMRLEPDILKHRLSDDEKRALIFIASHYPANPV